MKNILENICLLLERVYAVGPSPNQLRRDYRVVSLHNYNTRVLTGRGDHYSLLPSHIELPYHHCRPLTT